MFVNAEYANTFVCTFSNSQRIIYSELKKKKKRHSVCLEVLITIYSHLRYFLNCVLLPYDAEMPF